MLYSLSLYYKQGDDYADHFAKHKSDHKTLLSFAQTCEKTAALCRRLAEHAKRQELEIVEASGTYLFVECAEKLSKKLLKEGVLSDAHGLNENDDED